MGVGVGGQIKASVWVMIKVTIHAGFGVFVMRGQWLELVLVNCGARKEVVQSFLQEVCYYRLVAWFRSFLPYFEVVADPTAAAHPTR